MWRIAEQDAVRRRLAPGGGDACRQPRCRYCIGMWRITEQDAIRRRLAPGGGDASSPDVVTSEMV